MGAWRSSGFYPKPSLSTRPANIPGRRISSTSWPLPALSRGSQKPYVVGHGLQKYFKDDALVIALVSRGVDVARIVDGDGSGAEVWWGRKTPSEPS
jgi:hypothetical protein